MENLEKKRKGKELESRELRRGRREKLSKEGDE